MKLSACSLVWLAGTGVVQGFSWSVPPGMEDGLYTIDFHEDDTNKTSPNVQRRSDIVSHDDKTLAARDLPLPISRKGCIEGFPPLDADDYWASKVAMNNWCSRGGRTRKGHAVLALKGTVLVWLCSYGWFSYESPCSVDEFQEAEAVWNKTCGHDVGAFIAMGKWAKTYGRSHKDLNKIDCGKYE
ncbi:hypothetical protein G7Z17_g12781 [Cylindrodendrum hubeiense]|uniref:Uncharacterized protein n=1 Tax=Cylindrodendrum hubeiense TaxID=595255 RepID=A0A9P5GUU8_9HYPO|nr:hypothetical protein G7Z17_g12781 [Cylindrodendrum hubeiense]